MHHDRPIYLYGRINTSTKHYTMRACRKCYNQTVQHPRLTKEIGCPYCSPDNYETECEWDERIVMMLAVAAFGAMCVVGSSLNISGLVMGVFVGGIVACLVALQYWTSVKPLVLSGLKYMGYAVMACTGMMFLALLAAKMIL